ncbi:MAG: hypothetical protein LRZ85_01420 [Alphaproteobacteria bacterium]|nr:hypothetical protein [Alphaproteobacteria bacterium]MCD8571281.1 hypothetical protein [Alphaproteobacteria bacterium]
MSNVNNLPSLSEKMAEALQKLDPGTKFVNKIQSDVKKLSNDVYMGALLGVMHGNRDIKPENRSGFSSFRLKTGYLPKNDTGTHYYLQITMVGVDPAYSSDEAKKHGIADTENHVNLGFLNLRVHKTNGTAYKDGERSIMNYSETQDAITAFVLDEVSKHMKKHQFEAFIQRMKPLDFVNPDNAEKPGAGL